MTDRMLSRIRSTLALGAALLIAQSAAALPPLGLTQLDTEPEFGRLAVIDGVAYISRSIGVQTVGANGLRPTIELTHPSLGPLEGTSRVAQATSGGIYVVGDYDGIGFGPSGSALYRIDQSGTPITNWQGAFRTIGLDQDLRAIANGNGDGAPPSQLFPDGTTESFPDGALWVTDVEPEGVVLGGALIPNTIGSAPALYFPGDDRTQLLWSNGAAWSIARRLDGQGVNIAFFPDSDRVRYGDNPQPLSSSDFAVVTPRSGTTVDIDLSIGTRSFERILVSESDFAVIDDGRDASRKRAFFPGINPAGNDRSVPLLDFFPALQSLDFDSVTDISSHGGRIHLLLSGDDGLWLFVAPDPTVVPEPAAAISLVIAAALVLRFRARGPRAKYT